MRYTIKLAEKDKYGVETNPLKRIARKAIIDAVPLPSALTHYFESESALQKKHPVVSLLAGQAGTLGAVNKNTTKDNSYFPLAMATGVGGGIGAALPTTVIGKLTANQIEKYRNNTNRKINIKFLDNILKNKSGFAGKIIDEYVTTYKKPFGKALLKTLGVTTGIALATTPVQYLAGKLLAQKQPKKSYQQ